MNEQVNRNDRSLVPAGRLDLVIAADANPLVSRGLADIALVNKSIQPASTLTMPVKLKIDISGTLFVQPFGGGFASVVVFAKTPGNIEVSSINLAEARQRKLFQRKQRFEKLRTLNAPEIVLQNEFRLISGFEDAWKNARYWPEDCAFSFEAEAPITDELAADLIRLHANIPLHSLAIGIRRQTDLSFLKHINTVTNLDCTLDSGVSDKELAHLQGLSNLRLLKVFKAPDITDKGVAHLIAHTRLEELKLSGCSVTGKGLAHLSGFTKLEVLNLDGSSVTDNGIAHFHHFSNLRVLSLNNCGEITDAGLAHLAAFDQLETLELAGCSVTDEGLIHFCGLAELKLLDLAGCWLTDKGLAHLRELSNLRVLRVSENNVYSMGYQLKPQHPFHRNSGRITDEGLHHVSALTQLEELELVGCSVTDRGLVHLGGLTKLKELYLNECPVTDDGLAHLRGLSNLRMLSLSDCREITDNGLAHLSALNQLEELHLAGRSVTDHGLVQLFGLKTLRVLNLSGCSKITAAGVAALKAVLPECDIF